MFAKCIHNHVRLEDNLIHHILCKLEVHLNDFHHTRTQKDVGIVVSKPLGKIFKIIDLLNVSAFDFIGRWDNCNYI